MEKEIKVEFGEMSAEEYSDYLNGLDVHNIRMTITEDGKVTAKWSTLNKNTGFKITGDNDQDRDQTT